MFECTYMVASYKPLTCNLYFHQSMLENLVVVGCTCIHSSIIRLYPIEMKRAPPRITVGVPVTRAPLSVYIMVTQLSTVNLGYTSAVRVPPDKSLQFPGTVDRSVIRSAPKADRLVSIKDNWTSQCRAVLSS